MTGDPGNDVCLLNGFIDQDEYIAGGVSFSDLC